MAAFTVSAPVLKAAAAVSAGRAGAREGADEVLLADENVGITAHLDVDAADAELVVEDGHALLHAHALVAELDDVA